MDLRTKYKNRDKNRGNRTSVTLVCKECNNMFTTTVGELCWHYDVGNLIPVYCNNCKSKRKKEKLQNQTKNATTVVDTDNTSNEELKEKLVEEI